MKRIIFSSFVSSLIAFSHCPMAHAAAGNLLVNPGFEEGTFNDPPPWAVGGWRGSVRATTAEAHSGKRSIMQEGGGDEGAINSIVQVVPIDPTGATKYTLRAWVRIPSANANNTARARVRWLFSDGSGAGQYTDITSSDWTQIDQGQNDVIPPPGARHMIFRIYTLGGHNGAYLDDCEMIPEPSGAPNYPGVTGTVKDQGGKPVAGAVVFLKDAPKAQEFAISSAMTDGSGNFTVCAKDDGAYYVVAWKQGYGLSAEKQFTIANGGPLAKFDPVLTKAAGGRDLAISTSARPTAVGEINTGKIDDPGFDASYAFDGNTISTRTYNNAKADPANDRWLYVDLDPKGKQTFTINEFVLYWLGVTQMTMGWPGVGDVTAKDFAIEYTSGDPAKETETGWTSKVAFTVTDTPLTTSPIVLRLATPMTARAVRVHMTNPTGGGYSLVECEVNSDKLSRGQITGTVKDNVTGAPMAGARVVSFRPVKIQNDPDIYGIGNPVPFVVAEEIRNGTPYDYAQGKNTDQIAVTDANGNYTLDVNPGTTVRVTASAAGYAFTTVSVTAPDDGSAAKQDFGMGKEFTVSGVVKDSKGPIYNAVVQVGGANSPAATITDANGAYSFVIGAGSQELYADAFGHAGKLETVNLTGNLTKDILLDIQDEPGSLSADFEKSDGWEIAHFDVNWKQVGSRSAVVDSTQNATPAGKGSARIEDVQAVDAGGKELDKTYEVLQRAASKQIGVDPAKTYNVYFKAKTENWLATDNLDTCHYEVLWRDKGGAVLNRIYSHPYWIYPQSFWQQYSRGHPAGSDGAVPLVRLVPPSGAATLDLKIGWIRHPSGATTDKPEGTNPAGSQLFVDDLVIDAFSSGPSSGQKIQIERIGTDLTLTWNGVLESASEVTGPWAAVQAAVSPLKMKPDQVRRYFRSRSQ